VQNYRLAQPAPQRLDRHQIGAISGQWRQFDAKVGRGGPYRLGTVMFKCRKIFLE